MVVDEVAAAVGMVASGANVVLVIAEGTNPGRLPEGPGRLAVMVGDLADPETRAAAEAMHAELFQAQG